MARQGGDRRRRLSSPSSPSPDRQSPPPRPRPSRPKMRALSSGGPPVPDLREATASAPTSGSRPSSSTATSSARARRSTSGRPSGRSPARRATRQGGAIINGKTEPQGALAGGICSCSTTLFNAALRGGYEMGARRNHYYYIDRYPLGLDATVFISGGGSKQTMSWTNDTDLPGAHPRHQHPARAASGYVTFELYSVPTGRKVVICAPTVKNSRTATDSIQYTSSLRAGSSRARRVPGRRHGRLAHRHGLRGRQGPPPEDLLLALRDDHRDPAGQGPPDAVPASAGTVTPRGPRRAPGSRSCGSVAVDTGPRWRRPPPPWTPPASPDARPLRPRPGDRVRRRLRPRSRSACSSSGAPSTGAGPTGFLSGIGVATADAAYARDRGLRPHGGHRAPGRDRQAAGDRRRQRAGPARGPRARRGDPPGSAAPLDGRGRLRAPSRPWRRWWG